MAKVLNISVAIRGGAELNSQTVYNVQPNKFALHSFHLMYATVSGIENRSYQSNYNYFEFSVLGWH